MNDSEKVAIIGVSIKLPNANSINDLDLIFSSRKDCIKEVSAEKAAVFGLTASDELMPFGYIDDINKFDNNFFGISPREAAEMDFQQRIALEAACEAIEISGYSLKSMKGTNTAVIIGAEYNGYDKLYSEDEDASVINTMTSYISGRISYMLDLHGEAVTISSACSSSMYAVYDAYLKLITHNCDAAITGGISIFSELYEKNNDNPLSALGILSKDYHCKAFDDLADGIGVCEGAVFYMLKRLSDAEKDGDNILGVITSVGANQDGGRSQSFSSPSSAAQAELYERVWRSAGISPEDIGYIESHGTGTRIGDPIEIDAITKAFRKFTDKKQICPIGSCKTNFGHPLYFSGAVSLAKALTSVMFKKKYPLRSLGKPNTLIDFENSPVYPIIEAEKWDNERRIAAINNFGLSGTNVHMLIENYTRKNTDTQNENEHIVCISTKSAENLAPYKQNMLLSLDKNTPLSDIAYTMCYGRDSYQYRDSAVIKSFEELEAFLKKDDIYHCEARPKLVLFLSGNREYSESDITALSRKYDTFSQSFSHFDSANISENARNVAVEAALLDVMKSFGINADVIIATGRGRASAELYNSVSVDIEELCRKNCGNLFDKQGFISYMIDLLSSEANNIICAELTEEGILTDTMKEHFSDTKTLTILKNDSINVFLSELFKYGYDIDFSGLYKGKNCRKVMLATYPFIKTTAKLKNINTLHKVSKNINEETEPSADLHEFLTDIIKSSLNLDTINDDDDLFDLGFNSLISVSIIKKIRKRTNIELETDDFYEYSTISDLYEYLSSHAEVATDTAKSETESRGSADNTVLSGNQERMLFFIMNSPNKTVYNMLSFFRINGELDKKLLKESLDEIIAENDILHTVYPYENGTFTPRVLSTYETSHRYIREYENNISILNNIVKNENDHVFELSSEIPIRTTLIEVAADTFFLIVNVHHIACDGWTLGIFLQDINRIYNAKLENNFQCTANKKAQYSDYALEERAYIDSDEAKHDIEFWKKALKGTNGILKFPINKPRPPMQNYHGSSVFFNIEKELADKAASFCRERRISKFAFFESAYAVLLHKYSGDNDFCIGIPTANRDSESLDNIYGFIANTIPIRSCFSKNITFDEFVTGNNEMIQSCLKSSKLPFDEIVKNIECERNPSYSPVYQYFLSYQNFIYDNVTLGKAAMTAEDIESYSVRMDLNLIMKEFPDGIHINAEYDTDLFTKDYIKQITDNYITVIERILNNSDTPIDDITLNASNNSIRSESISDSLF